MATDYTRLEIQRRVGYYTRDTGLKVLNANIINTLINDVMHDFVERTECNRNVLIFSLADGTADGVIEYDRNANAADPARTAPTVTRVDADGYNFYKISNCNSFDDIERWVTTDDGNWTILHPVDQYMIAQFNLLSGDSDYPMYYETSGHNMFRLLKNLATGAYTIKIRVHYRESVVDLIDEADPDAAAGDDYVPISVPLKYRKALVPGVVAEALKIRGDERWGVYQAKYEALAQECAATVDADTSDRRPYLKDTHRSAGG